MNRAFSIFFNKLSLIILLTGSSLTFGQDVRNIFLKWLEAKDPKFSIELVSLTNQKFRARYGFFKSRYSEAERTNWSEDYLALAEQVFKEKTSRTIIEFCNITNSHMKTGISNSASRFEGPGKDTFSGIYQEYLSSNLNLAKSGKDLTPSQANGEIWSKAREVAALESMGGNAGPGAVAVNFLFDKNGRILFVGNHQDANPEIRELFRKDKILQATVLESLDSTVWQLESSRDLSPELKERLTQDLTRFQGSPPQPSAEVFRANCNLVMKKLSAR